MAASDDPQNELRLPRGSPSPIPAGLLPDSAQSEDAMWKQSEWLRVTLASIGDGLISTDASGNVTFMNGIAENLTGWKLTDAAGRPLPDIFQIVNERTRLPVANPVLGALQEGAVVALANHTILIARDGTERPIEDSAAPMRSEAGETIGAVLVFRDVSERKRSEEVRTRLAAIVETSDDAIISKTLDGIIRTWNYGAQKIFGYTAQEAIGQSITMLIPHDRQDEELLIVNRLRRGERIDHFETQRIAKDGRLLDISLTVSPLADAEGKIIGASKIARDITAHRRAEREQRQLQLQVEAERSRLDEAFQHAPSFLAVLRGQHHVFELANERYYELIGHREIIGKPIREALPEIEGQGFFELLDDVYLSGEPFLGTDMRVMVQRDPGQRPEERFVEFVYQPLRGVDGAISGILAQGVDLTERHRAQRNLAQLTAESERRRRLYETILSGTPDFVYVFSLDHRVLYANQSLLTMWGLSYNDTVGKTFLEIGYEPWHAEMHCREIDEVRATKQPIRGEVPFNGTHGRRIYDYIFVPVFGADGEVEAVAGTTRDITERRNMEDALRLSDRNKDEFIALLAHELRNPLAPLRSGLQVMRLSEENADAIDRARGMMERQLGHMVRIIDDLLDISRLSQNKMELRRTRVRLEDAIDSAVETAGPAIEAAGHELIISLPREPIYLDADLTRLAQVFNNLLSNSTKYTDAGGKIWLTAERRNGEVLISVRDNGFGIPAEFLPNVFDMFSQVDRSIERTTGGLGIGLAIVKGLVEKHGGTVAATSEGPGKGSTFTITLPMSLACTAESPSVSSMETGKKLLTPKIRRILVVDDNHDGATTMAMMLELSGHEVAIAHDGVQAVEAASAFRPSVILMDVGMPRMNGYDATRAIRAQALNSPPIIIALTGWGQDGDRELSKAAGCDGHLVKPVSLSDLEKLLGVIDNAAESGQ